MRLPSRPTVYRELADTLLQLPLAAAIAEAHGVKRSLERATMET